MTMYQEDVYKKRLLYDGHGSGEDKKIMSLLKNLTKFFLTEDSNHDVILDDLSSAIESAEKHDRISDMYERTFASLESTINQKVQGIEDIKLELANLKLYIEYVEKLRKVEGHPSCETTQAAMLEVEKKKKFLLEKLDHQRGNIVTLLNVSKELQRMLEDNFTL